MSQPSSSAKRCVTCVRRCWRDAIALTVVCDYGGNAKNSRALRWTCWTPSGVCVLVGPNGAGKTTLLALLEILRNSYLRNAPTAIDHFGGGYGLRSWGAPEDEAVLVAITVGDLRWEFQLTAQGPTFSERLGERVTRRDEIVLSRAAFVAAASLSRSGAADR